MRYFPAPAKFPSLSQGLKLGQLRARVHDQGAAKRFNLVSRTGLPEASSLEFHGWIELIDPSMVVWLGYAGVLQPIRSNAAAFKAGHLDGLITDCLQRCAQSWSAPGPTGSLYRRRNPGSAGSARSSRRLAAVVDAGVRNCGRTGIFARNGARHDLLEDRYGRHFNHRHQPVPRRPMACADRRPHRRRPRQPGP